MRKLLVNQFFVDLHKVDTSRWIFGEEGVALVWLIS